MATQKGLFKDDTDRFSDAHFQMAAWFVDHAVMFVRRFLFDRPNGPVKVTLERLVTNNKFIIGYADVILEYETDVGAKEVVLVELKSRLTDPSACLRQLRASHEYLSEAARLPVFDSNIIRKSKGYVGWCIQRC